MQKTWEQRGAVAGAHLVGVSINQLVKKSVGRLRPDGSEYVSFYSGHTSEAFLSAGAICLSENDATCIGSLLLAGTVGYLRIAADKHWASDVIVGAGIGYACGRLVPTIVVEF
jgi:membrane-associated phospholipid phosphatase